MADLVQETGTLTYSPATHLAGTLKGRLVLIMARVPLSAFPYRDRLTRCFFHASAPSRSQTGGRW
jgi:hypothetical protein